MNNNSNQFLELKKEKGILKAIGSILIAIVASSHHWVHTLLIALGLTSLGTGLLSLPPWIKIGFMLISLFISFLMLRVAKRKWNHHRSVSWVYLISSILSIIIVLTSLFQVFTSNNPNQQNKDQKVEHQQHHNNKSNDNK
jgi:phosphotransferase system  glucose/maltose/N-acetylglucosamine-specific IIC component